MSAKHRILVVEDDRAIAMGLAMNLRYEGYEVAVDHEGESALGQALDGAFDLVILDVMLPGMSGYEIVQEMRRRQHRTPVLMLSAKGQEEDKITGLELGADDYITKPFALRELLARVKAHLRRSAPAPGATIRFGDVEVDLGRRTVHRDGAEVALTPQAFKLLVHLIEREGRPQTRDQLLEAVWGSTYVGTTRTVDNFLHQLREKLDDPDEPRHFLTVRGVGYRFER